MLRKAAKCVRSQTCRPPHPAFRAGGTAAGAYGSSQEVKDLLGGLFHYVAVEPPPEAEQQRILARLHPQLAPLLPHAMDTLALVRAAYGQAPHGWAASEGVAGALAASGIAAGGASSSAFGFSVGRHFSIRDVLKWCRRMGRVRASMPGACLPSWPTIAHRLARVLPWVSMRALAALLASLPTPTHLAPSPPAAARRAAAALAQAQQGGAVPRVCGGGAGGGAGGRVCGGRRLLLRAAGPRRGERPARGTCEMDQRAGQQATQLATARARAQRNRGPAMLCPHPPVQAGERLLAALAALWAVPSEAVQQYAALHKPAVQAGAADLAVGRATLPLVDAAAGRAALAAAAGGADKVGARPRWLRHGHATLAALAAPPLRRLCHSSVSLPGTWWQGVASLRMAAPRCRRAQLARPPLAPPPTCRAARALPPPATPCATWSAWLPPPPWASRCCWWERRAPARPRWCSRLPSRWGAGPACWAHLPGEGRVRLQARLRVGWRLPHHSARQHGLQLACHNLLAWPPCVPA